MTGKDWDMDTSGGLLKPIRFEYDWDWNLKFNMSKMLSNIYVCLCFFVNLSARSSVPILMNFVIQCETTPQLTMLVSIYKSFPSDETDWFIWFIHFNQMSTSRWWHLRDVSFKLFEKRTNIKSISCIIMYSCQGIATMIFVINRMQMKLYIEQFLILERNGNFRFCILNFQTILFQPINIFSIYFFICIGVGLA